MLAELQKLGKAVEDAVAEIPALRSWRLTFLSQRSIVIQGFCFSVARTGLSKPRIV